jgi:penicillin-binding protein 1C
MGMRVCASTIFSLPFNGRVGVGMGVSNTTFMRRSLLILAATACAVTLAFAVSLFIAPYPVSGFESVRSAWRASDAWLLDRSGEPLSRVRIDRERRRGEWLAADEVSPALVAAVLASEDRRFREHSGVDWLAMVGAFGQTAAGVRRGGSTLTMQLAAYLHTELETGGRRNLLDKWRQMRQALALERAWTKDRILEAWLNLTPFRGEVEGADAAARALLGKRAGGLDRVESALLAALVRAPNSSPSRVARRACVLLGRDEQACLIAQGIAAQGFYTRQMRQVIEGDAPHLARKLLAAPGERLASTLDARVQRFATDTLQRHLRELEGRNVEDGALIVLDNATGEALAWVGSSGELSRAHEVDGVVAQRQAGSTLKPFLYALAIERRLLTAASILDDSPLAVTTPAGLYVPQNYDHSFKGHVSLRQALASSLNVPAVRTLTLVGYDAFHQQLRALGLASLTRDADHYGYALALGGADVTLVQLTNAYRALANGGRVAPIRTRISGAADAAHVQAIGPGAAYIVGEILSDAAARALTFGLASPLATRYPASVKTGTSKDMRDNWAIGYTGRYTAGVWVGNFSGEAMHDVSGIAGAAPIWREVMDFLHEGNAPARPTAPPGLVHQRVFYEGGIEPEREEWFLAGTEANRLVAVTAVAGRPRIESPSNGAVYAIDPDIPRERQRIKLTARATQQGAWFVLDDGRRARADAPLLWLPQPGVREAALLDAAGNELDRVRFEVRGLRR